MADDRPIVLDQGTGFTKCGFAGQSACGVVNRLGSMNRGWGEAPLD
jgi:hypothetical protein